MSAERHIQRAAVGFAAAICVVSADAASAADLPVKAKAVEYVKVCSLYGQGFYYIPGTDTCIKIGGYVRYQTEYNSALNGIVIGSGPLANSGRFTRDVRTLVTEARAALTADVRTQTEYGTLRSYVRGGWQWSSGDAVTSNNNVTYFDRGFIQFAGFTFGKTRSFFDIFTYDSLHSYSNARASGDTITYGQNVLGYTAQFGNGWSLNLSIEEPRQVGVVDGTTGAAWGFNGAVTADTGGNQVYDFVANLRVDQPWGYFGISGALHDVRGAYYTTNALAHPDDKWGWAVGAGGQINLWGGDTFGVNVVYSKGAAGYATNGGSWQIYRGDSVGVGWITDAIFDGTTGASQKPLELTEVWSAVASYERVWNPKWRTSFYGGYTQVSYNDAAKTIIASHLPGAAGTIRCGVPVAGAVWPAPLNIPIGSSGSICDPDFAFYQLGSRTQFNPTPQLDIGLDITYTRLLSAFAGSTPGLYSANGTRPATSNVDDQHVWSAIFRVQRNFYP
jgi:hypothetical protein